MPSPPSPSPSTSRSPSPSSQGQRMQSPRSTTGNQPFIYPIRSAVSVKPVARRQSQASAFSHEESVGSRTNTSATPNADQSSSDARPPFRRLNTKSSVGMPDSASTDFIELTRHAQSDDGISPPHSPTLEKPSLNGPDSRTAEDFTVKEREQLEGFTQTRFTHVATPEGHMVLTGRDGVLLRCEDEPIHIPGAVQTFGCLIVVREEKDGSLSVRQASENTADIIGLSPGYLFSQENFLDCLEEDQADLLWDAMESLEEREEDLIESGPHVFQLSGFGQPGSGTGKAKARMHWRCWCAAHRSFKKPGQRDSEDGLAVTILEFEPIVDRRYPLMTTSPLPSPAIERSETESMTPGTEREPSTPNGVPGALGSIATIDENGETKLSDAFANLSVRGGLEGMPYVPTVEQLQESTTSTSRPIKALQRLRRKTGDEREKRPRPRKTGGAAGPGLGVGQSDDGMLDMFGILTQINEQFSAQTDLPAFLKVVVSVVRELTNFSRVMIYQFDEQWNGQVVCELVDIKDTHDLYRGLNFPATDIPKQARDLYRINKVRMLYDRSLNSARMVCREKKDLETPVDMTHSFLRAMSPIHIKYLENMGVRASMSCSIMAFGQLWGLISCHTYGSHGRRVGFPMRQLLRLVSDSVSRNIERLSYTKRLQSRKLINTLPTAGAPSGYILTRSEELLDLFDADFGVIAIGSECKILGSMTASQEILALTEYLRLKRLSTLAHTANSVQDFPDMSFPPGLDMDLLAGVLYIPLTDAGADFIVFIRRAQTRTVSWAGKPFKEGKEGAAVLEPRKSFKLWNETVIGTCRAWKDEELETAGVLSLVYGKFISVWRSKEAAMQNNQLNRLLLSNASHEVRTPLHHLVSYLELALDGPLDPETRDNLARGRIASKSLLFTINDLLDISRAEQGKQLFLQEPLDLAETVREAVEMHEWEAKRRKISFDVTTNPSACVVLGDRNRLRQILVNTASNAVRHTDEGGSIHVKMTQKTRQEASLNMPDDCDIEVELSVIDTGCGIPRKKLEAIFREFEQVESLVPEDEELSVAATGEQPEDDRMLGPEGPAMQKGASKSGLGVGLAVVARIVRNLKGQLSVDSNVGVGSTFIYTIPFKSAQIEVEDGSPGPEAMQRMKRSNSQASVGTLSSGGGGSEIDSLVEVLGGHKGGRTEPRRKSLEDTPAPRKGRANVAISMPRRALVDGIREVAGSRIPLRPTKIDPHSLDAAGSASGESTSTGPGLEGPSHRYSLPAPRTKFVSPPDSIAPPSDVPSMSDASSVASRRVAALRRSNNQQNRASVIREKVAPLRVLVVEDDPINRTIIKKRLAIDKHTVLQAMNGEEGVHKFEEHGKEIDVILMDLQMPICNGQDACKRIRALEKKRGPIAEQPQMPESHIRNGRIPILAVSATLDQDMREEMISIGMDGFILKPVDFGRLNIVLNGVNDSSNRKNELWAPGRDWEKGGWLSPPSTSK